MNNLSCWGQLVTTIGPDSSGKSIYERFNDPINSVEWCMWRNKFCTKRCVRFLWSLVSRFVSPGVWSSIWHWEAASAIAKFRRAGRWADLCVCVCLWALSPGLARGEQRAVATLLSIQASQLLPCQLQWTTQNVAYHKFSTSSLIYSNSHLKLAPTVHSRKWVTMFLVLIL